MTTTDHPLTETAAAELWDAHRAPATAPFHVQGRLYARNQIAMLRAAFDAGREHEREHTDPHHDPRPWQDCTPMDIRKGDLVASLDYDRLRIGVACQKDEEGNWRTKNGWLVTWGDRWPVRRIPAPTTEKDTAMTETTPAAASSEPLARTLLAVPDAHGAPHHDADRIKQDDFVADVDKDGTIRSGLAHHQDGDGDWENKDRFIVTYAARRADRPDALTVWPAPVPPAEEVELPTTDGAVIIPAEGHEFIEAKVGDYTYITREAVVCQSAFGPANVLEGAWRRVDDGSRAGGQVGRDFITPATWQEDDQ